MGDQLEATVLQLLYYLVHDVVVSEIKVDRKKEGAEPNPRQPIPRRYYGGVGGDRMNPCGL